MQSILYSRQIIIQLDFPDRISKNTQISNFMLIRPVLAELFHAKGLTVREPGRWAKGQTDMTKLIVAFHNFVTPPKM